MPSKFFTNYENKKYTITIYSGNDDIITFGRDNIYKTVKVIEIDDRKFVYKIQKTQIKANRKANGLFDFMSKNIEGNSALCWNTAIIDYAIDHMKEIKNEHR